MAIKTLKIRRVFAYAVYNSLKRTPPKDFPTTGEIKTTIAEIMPVLKVQAAKYVEFLKQAEELAVKVAAKELTEEASKKAVDAINDAWKLYTKEHGDEKVDVVLEGEAFTTLKAQFEREKWGTTWLANIEEFGEFSDAMVEAGK